MRGNNTEIQESVVKLKKDEVIGYGLAGAANNVIFTGMSTFLLFFYTDIIGIAGSVLGTIMLFSRFLDGISDVVMGVLVDKTNSKHGKTRPWVLWMAVPFAIIAVALFTVPDIVSTAQIIYIIITYNIALLIYTATEIPHGTLGALMTQDQHQRSILSVAKMTGAYIAIIPISGFTVYIVEWLGGGQSGWIYTFVIYGVIAVLLYFNMFRSTKERVNTKANSENKLSIKLSLKALLKNKYWAIVTLVFIAMYMWISLTSGAAIYYSKYILGDATLVGILTTTLSIATIASMGLMIPISKKFGKRNTMVMGCIVAILGTLVFFIDPTDTIVVTIGQILRGFGKAAVMGIIFAILADTMEYGEWKTGIRIEGLIYSGASMGIKIGTGVGSALIGWVLAWGGYIGGKTIQSAAAITSIKYLFIYIPIILSVIMIIFLLFYNLDKKYPKILKELSERTS
ncbi:MFS transporter [Staphylococcus nepalensis]|uniref:MFS transporter n=2 Tax=Staphylococcus nepalensis TaxID=214473 RepID=A0A2T4SD22_9STAP|nr:glycoside-pentoside-hexuronide (GPH):cation symporter [Staphylococcus nepalensis]PTK60238.1 MFS transporter [Staphylococcus nepalensis]